MSNRTPFPWVIHEGQDYTVLMGPDDTTDLPIATIHRAEDAPLLGAAPAMLEALLAYDEAVQEVLNHWHYGEQGQSGHVSEAINALEKLRVTKATRAIEATRSSSSRCYRKESNHD